MTPNLSVVVPTFRRPGLIERCVASLVAQDLAPERYEVVVVDDGSGDRTPEVLAAAAASAPNLRWTSLPQNRGPAAARNRGIEEASGWLVLFVDDDVVAPAPLLATHLDLHERAGDPLLGILGRVDWAPGLRVTPFMRWLDHSGLQFGYETWLHPGPVEPPHAAFYTANLSMRREVLTAAGGFDERFPYASYEDMELAWRLAKDGFHLTYHPEALAYHARAIDLSTFRRRMARVAESGLLLQQVQPEFPVDADTPAHGWLRKRERLKLRALAPLAVVTGRSDLLERYYRAEVAAAFSDALVEARRARAT